MKLYCLRGEGISAIEEPVLVFADALVPSTVEMILELLLHSYGYVAIVAHLLLDLAHPCEVFLPDKLGFICLCGIEEDVKEILFELVLLAKFGVLFFVSLRTEMPHAVRSTLYF